MDSTRETYRAVIIVSPGLAAPYVMLDFDAALRSLGHETLVLDFRKILDTESPELKKNLSMQFKQQLLDFKPHFAVFYDTAGIIDRLPFETRDYEGHMFEEMGVPYVSLFYDSPMFSMYLNAIRPTMHSPLYTVFIWDRYYLEKFQNTFNREAHYLPLATNPDVFRPVDFPDEYAADITFIGSIAGVDDFDRDREAKNWPDWLIKIANIVVLEKTKDPDAKIDQVLQEVLAELPAEIRDAVNGIETEDQHTAFMCSMYDQVGDNLRRQTIRALPRCNVHVHGGAGWKKLARNHITLMAPVEYHTETPRVYNAAKINLNITSAQLVTAVNQRVFDVPACGGFLLTDFRSDLPDLLIPNEEIVVYEDLADMRKKIRHYLEHEDQRLEIARRGRERVIAEHTYAHRAQTVIRKLKEKKLI